MQFSGHLNGGDIRICVGHVDRRGFTFATSARRKTFSTTSSGVLERKEADIEYWACGSPARRDIARIGVGGKELIDSRRKCREIARIGLESERVSDTLY